MFTRNHLFISGTARDYETAEDVPTNAAFNKYLRLLKPVMVENVNCSANRRTTAGKACKYSDINDAYKDVSTVDDRDLSDLKSINGLVRAGVVDDSDNVSDDEAEELVIPPLNTDIRLTNVLPEYASEIFGDDWMSSRYSAYPHDDQSRLVSLENFSWHVTTDADSEEVKKKKALIHPVQNQHMCGSCWAMALASCISDCFVVAGVVNWMPKIAPTFLMMTIPRRMGNAQCEGGNPAETALALESIPVADTTCIDYSWCANDNQLCTSASAVNHFRSTLGEKLNSKIPSPESACYFDGDRYLYRIDRGTEALYITEKMPAEQFREVVKRHIVEFGPPLAGYVVLSNFIAGYFSDPNVNQGIYFDRAEYPSNVNANQPLTFRDSMTSYLSGFHAVSVVGWGLGKNVQYDNDKYGDVPYWIARNSWGSSWGHMNGYFRIAMYPWNKYAQFGKQITAHYSTIGGMILLRCTNPPSIGKLSAIDTRYLETIRRSRDDDYYKTSPGELTGPKPDSGRCRPTDIGVYLYVIAGIAALLIVAIIMRR